MVIARLLCVLLPAALLAVPGHGQVTVTSMPRKLQIFPRNLATDSAAIVVAGSVRRTGVAYREMRLKIYRNAALTATLTQPLNFVQESAAFRFAPSIRAELSNYRFDLFGYDGTGETLVRSADSVACGDAFFINGQSNAWATPQNGDASRGDAANRNSFIRTSWPAGWFVASGDGNGIGTNIGQWGLRCARLVLDAHQVPVAVINAANPGKPIQFFLPDSANARKDTLNYYNARARVEDAGLRPNIRAIFWFQGESNALANGNSLSAAGYAGAFARLHGSWLADFPGVEKVYVFQIRNGCGSPLDSAAQIKEAQRRLQALPKVSVMSASAQPHFADDCHYTFDPGYRQMGENVFRLVNRDLYGVNGRNVNAPSLRFAELDASGLTLTLIMDDILDSISWAQGAEADFALAGSTTAVRQGTCARNTVRLSMQSSARGATAISYFGHFKSADPMVTNLNGVGALHFHKFPITPPGYRDSVGLTAVLAANGISLPLDSCATFNPTGRIVALRLANRKVRTIPREIGFLDSLRTIDLGNNLLAALPAEMTRISPTPEVVLDRNRLCALPESISGWLVANPKNRDWRSQQMLDSTRYCDGRPVSSLPPGDSRRSLRGDFEIRPGGMPGSIRLEFRNARDILDVDIFTLRGRRLRHFDAVPDVLTIGLPRAREALVLLRVRTARAVVLERVYVGDRRHAGMRME